MKERHRLTDSPFATPPLESEERGLLPIRTARASRSLLTVFTELVVLGWIVFDVLMRVT